MGKKPVMILPGAAIKIAKPLSFDTDDEMSQSQSESESQ